MTSHHLTSIGLLLLAVTLTGGAAATGLELDEQAATTPSPARGFAITVGVDGGHAAWLGVVTWTDGDSRAAAQRLDPLAGLHRGLVITRVAVRITLRALERLLEHLE